VIRQTGTSGGLIVMADLYTIVLMSRVGPKPLIASGMLAASGGTAWLAQLGPHTEALKAI